MTKIAVFALLAASLVLTTAPALANCGGHCQQEKACGQLVRAKGLPKGQRQDEFNKCMTDPHNYK